jgi:hypothetical protein
MIANNAFPYRYFGCFAADCKAKHRAAANCAMQQKLAPAFAGSVAREQL